MAQYATTADLAALGLPAQALANVPIAVQNDHLEKSSARIDSYLVNQYTLPLTIPYAAVIVETCAVMAAYSILVWRGFNPDEYDASFRLRFEDCIGWLEGLARGVVSLDVVADATPAREGRPRIRTGGSNRIWADGDAGEARGW